MRRRNMEDGISCYGTTDGVGFWKALSAFWFLLACGFALLSFCLKQKNEKYRDALIDASENFPPEGAEAAEYRRKNWQSAHAPSNRKTVEERLEDQRIQES